MNAREEQGEGQTVDNHEKLQSAFCVALQIEPERVRDGLKYRGIEEWDSISHMILISELEDAFDISIGTQDVIDMSSFEKAREILGRYGVEFE